MPSQGVTKPLILSDSLEDNYVWEFIEGLMRLYPDFFEVEPNLDMAYAYDRAMQLLHYYSLKRTDDRHFSDNTIKGINYDELDDLLQLIGVPFIKNDITTVKRIRARDMWTRELWGGTKRSIKAIMYTLIGSGALYPYDTVAGQANYEDTNRIQITKGEGISLWGSDTAAITYTNWEKTGETASGTWASEEVSGVLNNWDLRIYLNKINDFNTWNADSSRADIYYLMEKIKPMGMQYTINVIFDGISLASGSLVYWEYDGNSLVDSKLSETWSAHTGGTGFSGVASYVSGITSNSGALGLETGSGTGVDNGYGYDWLIGSYLFGSGVASGSLQDTFSLHMWLQVSGTLGSQPIWLDGENGDFQITSSGTDIFDIVYSGVVVNSWNLSGTNFSDGDYHMIDYVHEKVASVNYGRLYFDGALVSQVIATHEFPIGHFASGATVIFGGDYSGDEVFSQAWNVDQLGLFSGALSTQDILDLYEEIMG
jgi:hypothetical protein